MDRQRGSPDNHVGEFGSTQVSIDVQDIGSVGSVATSNVVRAVVDSMAGE
jgi:hypothetical protein